MNISFNRIPNIKFNNGVKTPSFKASDLGDDKFVKSDATLASFAEQKKELLKNLSGEEAIFAERVLEEKIVSSLFDSFCADKEFLSIIKHFPKMPISSFLESSGGEQDISEVLLKYFNKANIKNFNDLSTAINVYNVPRVKNTYNKAPLEFFEIYGQVQDRSDLVNYPELLLHLNDLFFDQEAEKLTTVYSSFTSVLKLVEAKNLDEFKEKFSHLSSDFNDFSTVHDVGLALIGVLETFPGKLDLLSPLVPGKNADETFDNACDLYVAIPDIIDALYKENNGESLGDIKDILPFATAQKDLSKRGVSLLSPYFNDFSTHSDKLRFYRTLANNNITVNSFKKLFSKPIFSELEPLPLIYNSQTIIENLTQKEKNNKGNATAIYFNFADVLNVAYSAENPSEIINETYSLIKNCKFKSSSDMLDFYNQCNIPNGKAKSLTNEQFLDFIDLMRFADKSDFKDLKKVKKIRLDNLRKTREEYNNVKGQIEKFLFNSESLYLTETPFTIFSTYKNDLIGSTPEKIDTLLFELDAFGIKDQNENRMKNFEIDRLQNYFPSRKDVLSFVILNEISFDNTEEAEEYRLNCNKILKSIYKPYDIDKSHELIKKLSDSKFLINSKNSLNDLLNASSSSANTSKLITTLIEKNVSRYSAFENFAKDIEADQESFDKLVDFISKTPENITFDNILFQVKNLKFALKKSGFPIKLNVENLTRLSYEDLSNCQSYDGQIKKEILNKLLGLNQNQNPVLALPSVYTEKSPEHDKTKIAFELLDVKAGSDSYPQLIEFLFGEKSLVGLSHAEIKKYSYDIPSFFVDFLNTKFKSPTGEYYNMSLHSKLRIIERFLMEDVNSKEDFMSLDTTKKLDDLLNSIYNKEQLLYKMSTGGERILFNTSYNNKVIETVFNKAGILVTAVEKSYR